METKRLLALLVLLLIIGGATALGIFLFQKSSEEVGETTLTFQSNMKITSSAFLHNQRIPNKYTCDGEDINPPLLISDVPSGTASLALIMDDPDAPAGTWVHWIIWNISPETKELKEDSVPEGAVEGLTSFGRSGYGGPCPPFGTHRYFFKLYALDSQIELSSSADKSKLEKAMAGHILEEAEFIGLYSRR